MRRLSCLLLTIMLYSLLVMGCGSKQADSDINMDISSNAATATTNAATDQNPVAAQAETDKNTAEKNDEPAAAQPTAAVEGAVKLLVTRDFGSRTIISKQAAIGNDWRVIDLLQSAAQIETKWDGGFISSIEGLESNNGGILGQSRDWFYYINGICADAGAADYTLKPGDTVWWDYHVWKSIGAANSAVIGSYPEPFVHGYRGQAGTTMIMSSAAQLSLTGSLQKYLTGQGAAALKVTELNNNLLENRPNPTIVIAIWSEAKQLRWLENFNAAYKKTGSSVHFTNNGLELLDYNGSAVQTITGSGGVIVAAGSGLGDAHPLWLIIGTDQSGLQQAVDILVNNPEKISGLYGAAVAAGKVIPLPGQ